MIIKNKFRRRCLSVSVSIGIALMSGCGGGGDSGASGICNVSIATADVKSTESLAAQLVGTPQVALIKGTIIDRWRTALTARLGALTAEENAQLEPAVNELIFVYAQRAANSDPARPKISWTEAPPHSWGGTQVSGSRYAGDNPDNIYRLAPIDGVSTYEITGKVNSRAPTEFLIQVTNSGDLVTATDEISLKQLKLEADGSFKITVSPLAGDGTSNHLQTGLNSTQLFIRDTMADWEAETPLTLSIRRVSGPDTPPKTFDEMVQQTVATADEWGTKWLNYFTLGSLFKPATNTIPQPVTGTGNISRTGANFDLADDEAMVISVNPGPATYTGLTVQNIWAITPNYWDAQTSLTNKQTSPNRDGSFTYVLSQQDPGVYNWISTAGARRGTLYQRWQGAALPANPGTPYVSTQVVKLTALRAILPPETKYVTPTERSTQLAARKQALERRLLACDGR